MKTTIDRVIVAAAALLLSGAMATMVIQAAGTARQGAPRRPAGPCDIYAEAGMPCAAAHSTTRALYASYSGPLYQVLRQSDNKTLNIGVVQPAAAPPDAGGYADAAAQDAFCANTYCWITTIYDQSPKHNDLVQAPRGGFSGPAMGGFNNLPLADLAPVTIMGHKAYGVFIAPGMGLRQNDAKGTAVDDQAEGQYWVINGHHYNSGCCFDYGNAETDSRDDGNGTMETTYYGNATAWYRGIPPGPWIMTDQENNLVGCVNPDGSKYCPNLPGIAWRFVTATADGEPHHWRSMGGDAQSGELQIMFDGPRINPTYDPMRKQGAILLGNGGDNSVGSQGTFYEGAMTAAGTFPTLETNQRIQANVVAARYDVARLTLAGPGLQTFSPGSSRDITLTFTNTTGAPVTDVRLSVAVPTAQWKSVVSGAGTPSTTIAGSVAPGASGSATFTVTAGPAVFNGDLVGTASWSANGRTQSEKMAQKVRNVSSIKINEFRVSAGAPDNPTDSFIELYNAGDRAVDISDWSLTEHATQTAIFSSVRIPAGTRLAPGAFYLLGLSNSALAVRARAGDTTLYVRSTAGMNVGDSIQIGSGAGAETRRIVRVGTAAGSSTTLWQPLPDGPVIKVPAGSARVPVTSVAGFEAGQKVALGHGAAYPAVAQAVENYEVVTVTDVGKPGTQAWLSADAKAGDTNIKVSSVANISVGDEIRLDIDSVGHGIETVTVTRVGTASARNTFNGALRENEDKGTGLDLAAPLRVNHRANMPFSVRGTGIGVTPATAFAHSSNEPVLPLGTGITVDQPLVRDHAIDAVVRDAAVTTAGYQGTPAPAQWFGGPALSPAAGAMVLRDASGRVVDSLNYGLIVDPWASEGDHGRSGSGEAGCRVASPGAGGRGGFGGPAAQPASTPHRSAGRFPDGHDTDSNCNDFLVQPATTMTAASPAGATNVKVASVANLRGGQTLIVGTSADQESAVIATVGTAGATTMTAASDVGATVIPVVSGQGFAVGQSVTVDSGGNYEAATIASVTGGRGGRGGGVSITVATPLKFAHPSGAQVSGTGVTFTTPLSKAHATGTQVGTAWPTPGAPNKYERD
jgi:hypothetical protein